MPGYRRCCLLIFTKRHMRNNMKKCSQKCVELETACPNVDCRYWVEHQNSLNCCFVAIEQNGEMDLRTIGDIMGVSFVRIKQIQDKAVLKVNKLLKVLD